MDKSYNIYLNNDDYKYYYQHIYKFCQSVNHISYISFIFISQYLYYLCHKDRLKLVKSLAKKIENMNIVYVKLFQAICNNSTLLSKEEQQFLIQYTDNVKYNETDIDQAGLNILRQYDDIFIEDTPINSGVVAIVYKGRYKEKQIVVKVLKQNIRPRILSAINDYELLFKIMSYIPYLKQLNLDKLLKNNKQILIDQIDFEKEIERQNNFLKSNEKLNWITIPKVYTDLCNDIPNIIVMEYIDGFKINKIDNVDMEIFGTLIIRFCIISIIVNNIIHADMHSGNIIFIKNDKADIIEEKYKIGIIDFGLCIEPSRENQYMYHMVINNLIISKKFSLDIFNSNIIQPDHIKKSYTAPLRKEIMNKLNTVLDNYIKKNDMGPDMLIEFNIVLNKYNLYYSDEFNKILLSLSVCSETCKSFFNDWLTIYSNELKKLNELNDLLEFD